MDELYKLIAKLGNQYNAEKIILFGSRARGDFRERSDIDLAVYGICESEHSTFIDAIENLPTLLDFDLIFITENTNKKLIENIERDGVVIMSKFEEKYKKFSNAVQRLEEAIRDYSENSISSIRDGVIQRFEFCTELAWKTSREYLIEQGYTEFNSPKAVIKRAFADGVISDQDVWVELLNARNITSHIYDDDTAAEIFKNIQTKYANQFKLLLNNLAK